MKNKNNQPLTFWQWLHKYRAKIGLLAFVIAIPLSLVLLAYLGPYYSNKQVHFDSEHTDVQRQFVGYNDLDELTINIVWQVLKEPVYENVDDETPTTDGQYSFNISYTAKGAYTISSVSVIPVLHTDWFPYYSIGTQYTLSTTNRLIPVVWNELFPMRKLIFVEVNEPNLYLKVTYSYLVASETVTKTAYIEYVLKDLNPIDIA